MGREIAEKGAGRPLLWVAALGIKDYYEAWRLQKKLVPARRADLIPDTLLLTEHNPVFTLGKHGGQNNLCVTEKRLHDEGIPCIHTDRGGDITFHGPGQLVGYPILRLGDRGRQVKALVENLEEVLLLVLEQFGIQGRRSPGNPGVWVKDAKIGSIGLAIRKGISSHGFALNVDLDLDPFSWINPCGHEGMPVTSMKALLGCPVPMARVREETISKFSEIMGYRCSPVKPSELEQLGIPSESIASDHRPALESLSKDHEPEPGQSSRKPSWLKRRILTGPNYGRVNNLLADQSLHTVCQEARCPNRSQCFHQGIATFLLLGDRCTRNCGFCAVRHGQPEPPDPEEPARIAAVVRDLELSFVVLTSVTRDDLDDGGAGHFSRTVRALQSKVKGLGVEVLVPDFQGSGAALEEVLLSGPSVLNHNVETVPRLYPHIRPEADYRRSLELLERAAKHHGRCVVKSGLMLGLGESTDEVVRVMEDLLDTGCTVLTLGQYLQPLKDKVSVVRYLLPDEFASLRDKGLDLGFAEVVAAPYVRSSYRAAEAFQEATRNTGPHRQ